MATSPQTFVWYELMTTDVDAAEAFYRAVVGWTPQKWGQPDMRYTIMKIGETACRSDAVARGSPRGGRATRLGRFYRH
jgi:predicted enzyme related to lactoylglutathione lyase